jgi:hypothetical protein
MNLQEIKRIVDKFDPNTFTLGFNYSNNRFSNVINFKRLVEAFEPIPIARQQVNLLKNSFIFQTAGNEVNHEGDENLSIYSAAGELIVILKGLREFVAEMAPRQNPETVSVKLPEERDFTEVIKDLNAINTAITQNVVNDKISGVVVVKSWQAGSLWIDLYLGSTAAVSLVGGIAWSAAVVRKKWHEGSIMEKIGGSMDIKNETLESIRKGVKEHVRLVVESEAKNLLEHNFAEGDNHDQIERLKHGIKTFADLIERGAEVHPALQAPESVKNLFPDYTKLDLIESKQKLLEEKTISKDKVA